MASDTFNIAIHYVKVRLPQVLHSRKQRLPLAIQDQIDRLNKLLVGKPQPSDDDIINSFTAINIKAAREGNEVWNGRVMYLYKNRDINIWCKEFFNEINCAQSKLYNLPNELLCKIFENFNKNELWRVSNTNEHFRALIRERNLIHKSHISPAFLLLDYNKPPFFSRSQNLSLGAFSVFHLHKAQTQLICANSSGKCIIYDLIAQSVNKNLNLSDDKTRVTVNIFTSLTDELVISGSSSCPRSFFSFFSSSTGVVHIWNSSNWTIIKKIDFDQPVKDLAVLPDNKIVIALMDQIQIWNTNTWELLQTITLKGINSGDPKPVIRSLSFLSNLNKLLVTTADYGILRFDTKNLSTAAHNFRRNSSIVWSYAAMATLKGSQHFLVMNFGPEIGISVVKEAQNNPRESVIQCIATIEASMLEGRVTAIAVMDDCRILVGTDLGTLRIIEYKNNTWKVIYHLTGSGPILHLAVLSPGRFISVDLNGISFHSFQSAPSQPQPAPENNTITAQEPETDSPQNSV